MNAYIFDIDGTLTKSKGYTQNSILGIPVNEAVKEILLSLRAAGSEIIIVSGRKQRYRDEIFQWLSGHGIQINAMYLREDDDLRAPFESKRDIYEQHILGKYNAIAAFEDDIHVIDMYSTYGIQCLQIY